MSNWNHQEQYQYDSADLPFLPNSSADPGSLENSTPFWKVNSFTDIEKSFNSHDHFATKPLFCSPFMKLLNANSRSNDNVADIVDHPQPSPAPLKITAEQRRRLSQSLPASPLTTPGQTPLTTPNPTPQNSPGLRRKAEMDAVTQAAIRCSNRLTQHQDHLTQQNIKWFYMGFLPQRSTMAVSTPTSSSSQLSTTNEEGAGGQIEKKALNEVSEIKKRTATTSESDAVKKQLGHDAGMRRIQSDLGGANCRRKCGFTMSNRDMNFLAPTSM